MKSIKKYLIAGIVFLILFILSFCCMKIFSNLADKTKYDYKVVTVTVARGYAGYGTKSSKVYVKYNEKEYRLYSPQSSWKYVPGTQIQAYMCDGKMSADIDHIKDQSIYGRLSTYSFVAVIIFFIATLVCALSVIIDYNKLKKNSKNDNYGFLR